MEDDNLKNKIESLNYDWLRKNHERLYYFGLGFIQLKINEKYRLHFYTDKLDLNTDSIHNHRYDFNSKILKGSFNNKIFKLTNGKTHLMENESCNENIDAPKDTKECGIELVSDCTYNEGDTYFMSFKDMHQVYSKYAITLLDRSNYKQEYAQVITPIGEKANCPFSLKVNEEKLWAIIKEMIND
jgi:hypothetical protein